MFINWTHKITKEFYIGSRMCNKNPIDDLYNGSMVTWKLTKEEKKNLQKEIIKSDFLTYRDCLVFENDLIQQLKI